VDQVAKHPEAELCRNWVEIIHAFDSFPPPRLSIDLEGEVSRDTWIFRGLKSADYSLEPSVERSARPKSEQWAVLEPLLLEEFQSKARLYSAAGDLPPLDEKLSWLALMQHYSVSTRLIDFTYSPYLALYFALRSRTEEEKKSPFVKVWAIDGEAVRRAAQRISGLADSEEETAKYFDAYASGTATAQVPYWPRLGNSSFATARDSLQSDHLYQMKIVSKALAATGLRRRRFNESGFVALALPSIQNLRLSNQQGVFLFNGAEGLTFDQSLFKMMATYESPWCRLFQIPASELSEIERRLFQMNIHDLALFPDMEGLAGFINQKTRLHWLAGQ
jgi:hypothetical protein